MAYRWLQHVSPTWLCIELRLQLSSGPNLEKQTLSTEPGCCHGTSRGSQAAGFICARRQCSRHPFSLLVGRSSWKPHGFRPGRSMWPMYAPCRQVWPSPTPMTSRGNSVEISVRHLGPWPEHGKLLLASASCCSILYRGCGSPSFAQSCSQQRHSRAPFQKCEGSAPGSDSHSLA